MFTRTISLTAAMVLIQAIASSTVSGEATPDQSELASEIRPLGWICYSARTSAGDWDLFVMRPDGSDRRNITGTSAYNEGLPRFSADGQKLLYRRIPRGESFDNNRHGAQGELMLANRDGSNPRKLGETGQFAWASWMSDGKRLMFLEPKGFRILDIDTGKISEPVKRHGVYQQMTVSPDDRYVCGVSNSFGGSWSVARVDIDGKQSNAVSTVDCCTPDWFPDSKKIVYSGRPDQWTQLWMANADGSDRQLLYAEEGRHIYGGYVSPDGQYVIFTGNQNEDGDAENSGAPMNIIRLADAPMIHADSAALRQQYPDAAIGPSFSLPAGWEPHWTAPLPDDLLDGSKSAK